MRLNVGPCQLTSDSAWSLSTRRPVELEAEVWILEGQRYSISNLTGKRIRAKCLQTSSLPAFATVTRFSASLAGSGGHTCSSLPLNDRQVVQEAMTMDEFDPVPDLEDKTPRPPPPGWSFDQSRRPPMSPATSNKLYHAFGWRVTLEQLCLEASAYQITRTV